MRPSRDSGSRPRRFEARRTAGLIVAGLVFGAVASVLLPGSRELLNPDDAHAAESTPPAVVTKPAPAAPAPATATSKAAPAPAKPANVLAPARTPSRVTTTKTGSAPSLAVAPPGGVKAVVTTTRTTVTSGGSMSRVKTAAAPAKPAVVQPAHLDEHVTYQYNALGRRDPFQPILGGEFIGADMGGDAPVDIGGIKVVGIMWGASDKFALVEDGRGNSLVLRAGDKVMNGVVQEIRREAVVVKLTVDGQTQSVAIPLTRKGDHNDASR